METTKVKVSSAKQNNQPPFANQSWSENSGQVSIPVDQLKSLAKQISHSPSILDGLSEPLDLEMVKYRIFKQLLPQLSTIANWLGYGWVSGVNGKYVGDDYIWVGTGQKGGDGTWHSFTGPGFTPNMSGHADGYMSDKRMSIEFVDVKLTYSTPELSNARWIDTPETVGIHTFEVDNEKGQSPVSLNFNAEVFSQGQVGASTQKNWQTGWHWSVSSTQTINAGAGPNIMFPAFSLSFTETGGMSGYTGGSQSYTTNMTNGERESTSFSHQTPENMNGKYEIRAQSGTAAVDFVAHATLEFGVKFYGFLRWGGGKRFEGDTNYSNRYSGSGDRPTFEYTLGGNGVPFWVALKQAIETNPEPWNWNAMFKTYPGAKQFCENLANQTQTMASFPIKGVMAGVQRSDIHWITVSEDIPTTL